MTTGRKVGVVGAGSVGQACAFALVLRGSCRELVLVDRTPERATAVATRGRDAAGYIGFQLVGGTFMLMWAVMAVAVNPRGEKHFAGLVIGGALGLAVMVFGPATGAGLNPARRLGPALASGQYSHLWVYIAGPVVGALLAAFGYRALVLEH